MKILHLCLAAFYMEGMAYQENLLAREHKKMGLDVCVIAGAQTFNSDGESVYEKGEERYVDPFGIRVRRLACRRPRFLFKVLRKYRGTAQALKEAEPDVIFIHGVQFADVPTVIRYLRKHPGVTVYADNHGDFSNSARTRFSKNVLHKIIWRHYAKKIEPYVRRFYGVLPARVDFLKELYGLPEEKLELLVMGAEDELVKKAFEENARGQIRRNYQIGEEDFLIVTGGKIDQAKTQTLLLMDAVNAMKKDRVKLLLFGSVIPELKEAVEARCSDRVRYVGWIEAPKAYEYFAAADLVCFPGRHSVFWEQAAAMGVPMIVKYWKGTTHIDLGGNVLYLYQDTALEIEQTIRQAMGIREQMRQAAQSEKKEMFLYSGIARRSIRDVL